MMAALPTIAMEQVSWALEKTALHPVLDWTAQPQAIRDATHYFRGPGKT